MRWSALERGRFLVFDMSKTRKSLGGSIAVDSAVQHTVERGRARLSTVEHGRETVEIRYTRFSAVVSTALYHVQPQADGTEALDSILNIHIIVWYDMS